MKILLDENLPKKLKMNFGNEHQLFTVNDMEWNGTKNGRLLELLVNHSFNALLSIDKNLQYQQNLSKFPVFLIILNAPNNKIDTLEPYVEKLKAKLSEGLDEQIVIID